MAHAAGNASLVLPPTASALARHNTGRRRLPPAVRLYRMASASAFGAAGDAGSSDEAVSLGVRELAREILS